MRRTGTLVGIGVAVGLLAASTIPASAATELNGTLLEQLTSTGFVATPTPQPNPGDPNIVSNETGWLVSGVATISSTNAWAVGSYNDSKGTLHSGTEHFDGTWHNISNAAAPPDSQLNGVAAVSSNDVWAVGEQGGQISLPGYGVPRTLIENWNGTGWSVVPSANIGGSVGDELQSVSAAGGPDDIWAIGSFWIPGSGGGPFVFMEHWDGSTWTAYQPTIFVPLGQGGSDTNGAVIIPLLSISTVASNDAWAATGGGGPNSVIHWNGSSWQSVAGVFPNGYEINGIWAASSTDVWAVGDSLQPMNMPTLFEHWNGTSWSEVQGPPPSYTRVGLLAVSGSSSSNIYAVGAVATQSYPSTHTFVENWNGTAWSIIHSQNPSTEDPGGNPPSLLDDLYAVSVAPDAAFVAGYQGPSPGG